MSIKKMIICEQHGVTAIVRWTVSRQMMNHVMYVKISFSKRFQTKNICNSTLYTTRYADVALRSYVVTWGVY